MRRARTAVVGWVPRRTPAAAGLLLGLPLLGLLGGCSLGQGTGCFTNSSLDSPTCWSGSFDLQPNFFAAVPTNSGALELRIQNGIDSETFSDGLFIVVDDVGQVRGDPSPIDGTARQSLLGQPIGVSLSPAVQIPGIPIRAVTNPAIVHATLYLNRTCRTQQPALFALDAVTLEADGTCNRPEGGVEPPLPCGGGPSATVPGLAAPDASVAPAADGAAGDAAAGATEAGTPVSSVVVPQWCTTCPCPAVEAAAPAPGSPPTTATSVIRFNHLFDGNSAESNAQQRLTDADFDLYLGDPRESCPGGIGPPPRCRGHLQGHFSFYFQRGRPAQPFP